LVKKQNHTVIQAEANNMKEHVIPAGAKRNAGLTKNPTFFVSRHRLEKLGF